MYHLQLPGGVGKVAERPPLTSVMIQLSISDDAVMSYANMRQVGEEIHLRAHCSRDFSYHVLDTGGYIQEKVDRMGVRSMLLWSSETNHAFWLSLGSESQGTESAGTNVCKQNTMMRPLYHVDVSKVDQLENNVSFFFITRLGKIFHNADQVILTVS